MYKYILCVPSAPTARKEKKYSLAPEVGVHISIYSIVFLRDLKYNDT